MDHTPPRADNPTMRITHSMMPASLVSPNPTIQCPQCPITHRRHHTPHQPIPVVPNAQARNTRAQTAATTKLAAPPAHDTQFRILHIPQPTPIARTKPLCANIKILTSGNKKTLSVVTDSKRKKVQKKDVYTDECHDEVSDMMKRTPKVSALMELSFK